ncbi:Sec-independent protein translocase protein TatB [Amphritea sp. 2_MG-2023]|uniref:Sec-independent protein translocase protein TatB n=1 Tax=Amphritea TaxID=515417 RepID=UPI001C073BEA|nr:MULTISPECIES: Sec-independent protein translocase protein TatB [Amphritea]MBU2967746.1 Sec-independent protein translocase protein TatB [Amphritea atlantica]MDO6416936.1 Sec-independent protein translocase protein TatB [Amphritea sp. 2_MG-2023]MDX2421877.1 Sec-independent protein translocase protein TatB [Amphritea sp.]
MFDIGFAELLIIAVVGLVVLGPEKLPVAVRTVGLWVSKAKRTLSGIQSEISEELRLDEMKRQIAMQKDELDRELNEMRTPSSESVTGSPKTDSTPAPKDNLSQVERESHTVVASEQEKTKTDDRS